MLHSPSVLCMSRMFLRDGRWLNSDRLRLHFGHYFHVLRIISPKESTILPGRLLVKIHRLLCKGLSLRRSYMSYSRLPRPITHAKNRKVILRSFRTPFFSSCCGMLPVRGVSLSSMSCQSQYISSDRSWFSAGGEGFLHLISHSHRLDTLGNIRINFAFPPKQRS